MTAGAMMLQDCAPISLVELQEEAAFLVRRDRKYVLPVEATVAILDACDGETRVLEIDGSRTFQYDTTYFDNACFTSYHDALRKRPKRFKVRIRSYRDAGSCQLEAKVRDGRGNTVKYRHEHPGLDARLDRSDREWLGQLPQVAGVVDSLASSLVTSYRRSTLVLPGGAGRVTVDRGLAFVLPGGDRISLPGICIVETKGPGQPLPVDRLLWRNGYRPQPVSKYALGLSLLVPSLPANRWHRLRRQMQAIADRDCQVSEGEV